MRDQVLLDPDQAQLLDQGIQNVLESPGIWLDDEPSRDALGEIGAHVDHTTKQVRFPAGMVREHCAAMRELAGYDGSPTPPRDPGGRAQLPLPSLGTQVAQFIYDYDNRRARPGTAEDLERVVQIGDVLHGDEGVGHALTISGVSPFLEPLRAGVILARNARNPRPPFAWNVRQIPYLQRMGDALGRTNWFALGALCIAHPFRFDRDVAEKLYYRADHGYPTGLTAMPVAGITTPLTRGGFAVVAAAEIIACWITARAVNTRTPLQAVLWPGTVDLASGETSYTTVDSLLYGFTTRELLWRLTGIDVPIGGAEYADAKRPGYMALYEKVVKALEIERFSGAIPPIGEGMLDTGKTLCLEQLLMEREYTQALRSMAVPPAVTEESLGVDAIRGVGFGDRATHLETEHTLAFLRDSLWRPALLDRTGRFDDQRCLERAHERVETLRKDHAPPVLPNEVIRELEAVLGDARTGAS